MPGAEAWETFAQVSGVIIFLGGLVFGLRRLGIIGSAKPAAPAPSPAAGDDPDRVAALETRVAGLESRLSESYITRADWVPIASRMMGMMERNTEMLARLDERTRGQ